MKLLTLNDYKIALEGNDNKSSYVRLSCCERYSLLFASYSCILFLVLYLEVHALSSSPVKKSKDSFWE